MGDNKRIGLFIGSFDPFHIGHREVVLTALNTCLFDKIIICVGTNPSKKYMFSEYERVNFIKESFSSDDYENRIDVISRQNMMACDIAREINANVLMKSCGRVKASHGFESYTLCHCQYILGACSYFTHSY